jgi:hypothetical protein
MAATKENVGIELPPLNLQLMEVTLIGDSPLIVHAWSAKAKKEMLDKQMKRATPKKEAKDPLADFEASLYRLSGGSFGFPSVAFKNAAVTAITSVSGVTKIAARQAFQMLGEDIEVAGVFDGVKMRQNLVRIEGCEPTLREDMVRVGMGTADIRYRGEFGQWHAKLLVRFNAHVLSPEQILNILNVAGFAVGVGEWRSERDGQYGAFHVATEAELKKLDASAKRRAA